MYFLLSIVSQEKVEPPTPCVLLETKGYELLRYVTGAEFCSASESVPGLSGFLPEQNCFNIPTFLLFIW